MQGPGKGSEKHWQNTFSRTAIRVKNNLGIIFASDRNAVKKVRNKNLEIFDSYYDGTQYDNLPGWDDAQSKDGEYIPIRKRKPRIIYNFAKVLINRVASKLVGDDCFPTVSIEDDADSEAFIQAIQKASSFKAKMLDTVKLMGRSGSVLGRFFIVDGSIHIETFHSNYCYPEFMPNGELASVRIQYVYEDESDIDGAGRPKSKWYRLDLGPDADILYDNPEYVASAAPQFTVVSQAAHALGFVQAEWFRTSEDKHSPDGVSLLADVTDFIDEMNYSLSQASQAVGYGQEPQMTIKGIDADGVDSLVKSSSKVWNLGRDGEAKFVETTLDGVKQGQELRDKVRLGIQDVARVLLLDPEKIAGHAQSGKAMEVLHGPFVELIYELRPQLENRMISMLTKIALTVLEMNKRGFETDIEIPDGYVPQSLNMTVDWPQIFPMTMDDLSKKALVASQMATSLLISRETLTRWLAKDFGVENIDEELLKIKEQPITNPFGASFGDPLGSLGDPNQGKEPPNGQ